MGVVFERERERERERELRWRLHNTGSLSRLGVHSVPESEEKENSYTMEVQQCTPLLAELDDYMQETIFHMLGSCNVSQRQQNRSKSLVQHLHRRLSELEYKCAKSKARILLLLCKHFLCLLVLIAAQ